MSELPLYLSPLSGTHKRSTFVSRKVHFRLGETKVETVSLKPISDSWASALNSLPALILSFPRSFGVQREQHQIQGYLAHKKRPPTRTPLGP